MAFRVFRRVAFTDRALPVCPRCPRCDVCPRCGMDEYCVRDVAWVISIVCPRCGMGEYCVSEMSEM